MTDHAMSDRARAATDLGTDLIVTAGAGAGKTSVLVERFVKIARDPELGPERVLAITFTRKAAVEMKERVIRVLETNHETALRRRTEAAYISTIHGFAERILRERAFDAELDPAFDVLTEQDQAAFAEDALTAMYDRKDLHALAPRLGKSWKGEWEIFSLVRTVARQLREGSDSARCESNVIADDAALLELARARIVRHMHDGRAAMLICMRELEPLLSAAEYKNAGVNRTKALAYLAAIQQCLAQDSIDGVPPETWHELRFTASIDDTQRAAIRVWLNDIKKYAHAATFDDWAGQEALERELFPLKRAIYAAAADINARYADHKRRRGALDFNDLQHRAARLLTTRDDIRREYADRFAHILLDESQDTDELQYSIIQLLRSDCNTMFMVGDPKQAIFEFRGANPDVFANALRKIREEDRLRLSENFRSRREIVEFVNTVGPTLLHDQFTAIAPRADYSERPLDAPAITALYALRGELPTGGAESLSDARPREAAALAEEIVALLKEKPYVRDPEAREPRWVALQARHIALLFRTRTTIPYFEHALAERGVPYVTAAGQGFYERAEVLDCIMLLRAIAQPLDDLALAALLRSPFVGATDADLWRLQRARRDATRTRPLYSALRHDIALADFHHAFHRLRRRARGSSASAVLEEAIRIFGYEMAMAAHEDGPAMLANLAKIRRQVRDLGTVSAHEAFISLEQARQVMDTEALAPLVGPADDVVVLTTIHQAKGLEWPIVCLPNLQATSSGRSAMFSGRHGVLLCKAVDDSDTEVEPLSLAAIRDDARQRADAEERRLLYVALTRARERLILSATVTEGAVTTSDATSPKSFQPLAFLLASSGTQLMLDGAPSGHIRAITSTPPVTQLEASASISADIVLGTPVASVPDDRPLAAHPVSVKVTELLEYERCPQVYRLAHVLDIDENPRRRAAMRGRATHGPTPVELGTTVHGLLERARFDAPDRHAEAMRLVADEPAEQHERLRALLLPVLGGEIGDAIRGAQRVEREWQFAFELDGVLVEGVIDLAVQRADGTWAVYDYKSNDFSRSGRLDYLIDYYTPQLELYAVALSRAGLGTVAECALVFLAGPRVHRWSFDPATSNRASWAARTIARIAAGDYAATVGPQCEICGFRKRKICKTGRSWTPGIGLPSA